MPKNTKITKEQAIVIEEKIDDITGLKDAIGDKGDVYAPPRGLPKNTIDEILEDVWLHGVSYKDNLFSDIGKDEKIEEVQQALYQDLLECLPEKLPIMELDWQQHEANGHNHVIEKMEAKLKQYFGKDE